MTIPKIEPFDICMCTCNSAKTLNKVLTRITEVIPKEAINRKFIVDDFSTDETVKIAQSLGWEIYHNNRKGLRGAQAAARSKVTTKYYAMFEHDIYLAKTWFPTIPLAGLNRNLDGANGIRNRDVRGFREIDIYDNAHRLIVSEDNTFYAIKPSTGKYEVIRSVISIHTRQSTSSALRHGYFIYREINSDLLQKHLKSLGKSPILALKIGIETKSIAPIIIYPLERTLCLLGAIIHIFQVGSKKRAKTLIKRPDSTGNHLF